jgi:branched-subunit amino acid aminotransferase/4-amino-4-deoxychorismate lyase
LPFEVESLDAASARLPGGAYTTLRTYKRRKILRLDDHLTRLERSMQRLEPQAQVWLDRAKVRRALGQALDHTGFSESRLRLTFAAPGGDLFISVQPFSELPPELFERGVAVATCPYVPHVTQAKATTSITPLHSAQRQLPSWAHEGVMVNDAGCIVEGLTSNFFAVMGGKLHTAGTEVVVGTVRTVVLELAADVLPVVMEPVRLADLHDVAECFITSVSREVLPVVRVDDCVIGDGRPGAVARQLLRRYRDYVSACAETV